VPVPVTVRFVDVDVFHAVGLPASVQVPDPIANVRIFEFALEKPEPTPESVTLYVAASKVPEFTSKLLRVNFYP